MKIEMDGDTGWTTCVVAILLSLVMIILALVVDHIITTNWYTSRGYTQTTLPGSQSAHWVKEAK